MSRLRPALLATLLVGLSLALGCTAVPGGVTQTPSSDASHDAHDSHDPELSREKVTLHALDSHNLQIKGGAGSATHSNGILGFKGELLVMPGEASKSFAIEVGADGAFTSSTLHVHDGGKVTLFAFAEQSGQKTFSQPLTLTRRDLDASKLTFTPLDDHNVTFQGAPAAVIYGTSVVAFKGEYTTKPDTTPWKTLAVQADGSLTATSMHLHHGDKITLFAEADENGTKVTSKPVTLAVD
ncbi:hypothetical protein D3C86_332710 [compost metagenome]